MKIIQINNLNSPYQKGGAEKIAELINDGLKSLGHETLTICTYPKGRRQKEKELANVYYLSSDYANLERHSFVYRLFWQMTNLLNYKKYHQVLNILKNEKPDLVISHNLMGLGLLIPLAVSKSQARHLHVLHDIQLLHPSGLMFFGHENILNSVAAKIYQTISRKLFSLSKNKTIISPSKWLLDLHHQHGLFNQDKSFVINNPIPPKNNLSYQKEKSFVFVGQIENHKGVDLFIKAASFFPDYKFSLIGTGSLLEEIKKQKINNLEILGWQDSKQVSEIINRSLAIIVPSRCYENSPTVIYEAYTNNTPAIAADLGGIPELIEKFGGLLFTPDNLESLKDVITKFIAESAKLKDVTQEENYTKNIIEKSS